MLAVLQLIYITLFRRFMVFVCGMLTLWDWFDEVEMSFMLVGHTHGWNDSKFGNLQTKASKKKNCDGVKDLEALAESLCFTVCDAAARYCV
jgi:hypothetical protein